jgi:hypothetical protein
MVGFSEQSLLQQQDAANNAKFQREPGVGGQQIRRGK